MQYQGIFGLIVLIADVWAIVNIFQSAADTGKKVLWTVVVIILPVLGFILWYFLGPKTGRSERDDPLLIYTGPACVHADMNATIWAGLAGCAPVCSARTTASFPPPA